MPWNVVPFRQKRPTGCRVPTETLNGPLDLQDAGVQIHVWSLQAERLAQSQPTTEGHGDERVERMLAAGDQQRAGLGEAPLHCFCTPEASREGRRKTGPIPQ